MAVNRKLLKKRIKELGYTYGGVAKRAEISIHTLRQMASAEDYGMPTAFNRMRLAQVLETSELDLFPRGKAGNRKAS